MTDTLTTAKSLTIQTIGANSNTWGGIENTNLNLIDKALGQTLTKAIVGNTTLTSTEAQNRAYEFTGVLSGNATITFPAFQGPLTVRNKTTGGFSLVLGMATGTTVTIGAVTDAECFCDGTDFFLQSIPYSASLSLLAVVASTIANPGYIKFQNGLIFQWGIQAFVASTSVAVTFPLAFPTALFAVIATPIMVPGGNQTCGVQGQSTTGFNLNVGIATSNSQFWFAVGN